MSRKLTPQETERLDKEHQKIKYMLDKKAINGDLSTNCRPEELLDIGSSIYFKGKEKSNIPHKLSGNEGTIQSIKSIPASGFFTKISTFTLPYRGFPLGEAVENLDRAKKTIRLILEGIYSDFRKRSKIGKLRLVLSLRHVKSILNGVILSCHFIISKFEVKECWLSESVKEIYRVMSIAIEREHQGETGGMADKMKMIRDLVCMFLELDNAYRFRMQDILPEIDMNKIRMNENDICFANARTDYAFKYKNKILRSKGEYIWDKDYHGKNFEIKNMGQTTKFELSETNTGEEDIYDKKVVSITEVREEVDLGLFLKTIMSLQVQANEIVKQHNEVVDKIKAIKEQCNLEDIKIPNYIDVSEIVEQK
jgi:hypothetical protein